MDKIIQCNNCPLCYVEVVGLCEIYCFNMKNYIKEVRLDAFEEFVDNITLPITSVKQLNNVLHKLKEKHNEE